MEQYQEKATGILVNDLPVCNYTGTDSDCKEREREGGLHRSGQLSTSNIKDKDSGPKRCKVIHPKIKVKTWR